MGVKGYENGFKLTLLPERLEEPHLRKQPTTYFVNSMSDLFHEDIPDTYIHEVMDIIRQSPQHTFQILTKRAERMADFFHCHPQPPFNVWLGVTVENRAYGMPRIDYLREIDICIRFISAEPLLEDLGDINLTGIHWVIVGGESGLRARPMSRDWILNIKKQCDDRKVAFFFKQWGGWGPDGKKRPKKKNGRLLDGQTWDAVPVAG